MVWVEPCHYAPGARAELVIQTLAAFPAGTASCPLEWGRFSGHLRWWSVTIRIARSTVSSRRTSRRDCTGSGPSRRKRVAGLGISQTTPIWRAASFAKWMRGPQPRLPNRCLGALGPHRDSGSYAQWRESIKREFSSRMAPMRTS